MGKMIVVYCEDRKEVHYDGNALVIDMGREKPVYLQIDTDDIVAEQRKRANAKESRSYLLKEAMEYANTCMEYAKEEGNEVFYDLAEKAKRFVYAASSL